ncbi:hypothetical protein IV203_025627 [Nitzschia inconspicua]|uniref:Uncharacterized protein n=1 Tax=Nitzschia inconspicua TaxID=303405 RepID=A0A9K3PWG9_9STRA|nr:hypothetical protein IV203_025627 [Nitzschia inconspicua]
MPLATTLVIWKTLDSDGSNANRVPLKHQKVMTMLRGIVPMSQDQVRFGTDDSDLALKVDSDKTQPMSLAEDGYDDRDNCTVMVFQSITMIDEKFG